MAIFFREQLGREYRVWRLSHDPSLILQMAMAPPGDPWRDALGEFVRREYPPGIWRPSGASIGHISYSGPKDRQITVSGQTRAQDFLAYLSVLTGATVYLADGKGLEHDLWTKGVVKVLDVDLARAILHAGGIATLEIEEDGQKVLWAVDRSDFRRGERP
jgi:hypothetical protein